MEGGKLDCYISYTTGQTNNNTGDITTDEANNSGDLGLPCALREIDIDGGFKECHIPLEFSDCLLGNYLELTLGLRLGKSYLVFRINKLANIN